jgi:hypothetical protein
VNGDRQIMTQLHNNKPLFQTTLREWQAEWKRRQAQGEGAPARAGRVLKPRRRPAAK